MKLLILGATGLTGRHVVDQALRSGDSVTAFVRNPAALGDLADQVTVVTGDATSHSDLVDDRLPMRATPRSVGRTSPPSCIRPYTAASGSTAVL